MVVLEVLVALGKVCLDRALVVRFGVFLEIGLPYLRWCSRVLGSLMY